MFVAIFYNETDTSYKVLSRGKCDNFFAAFAEALRLVQFAYNNGLGPFHLHFCGFEFYFNNWGELCIIMNFLIVMALIIQIAN